MRILGLDLGARRIGLAVFDPDVGLALPGGILESRGRERDLAALCELIAADARSSKSRRASSGIFVLSIAAHKVSRPSRCSTVT